MLLLWLKGLFILMSIGVGVAVAALWYDHYTFWKKMGVYGKAKR